jgi:hypothetical protein
VGIAVVATGLSIPFSAFAMDGEEERDEPPAAEEEAAPSTEAASEAPRPGSDAPLPSGDGGYRGVVPGRATRTPLPPAPAATAGAQQVTWAGFQPLPGGGTRAFAQLTGPVEYLVREQRGQVVVTLKRCGIYLKNNRRKIDTRFFSGPIAAVETSPRGGRQVELRVKLRRNAKPDVRLEAAGDGSQLLLVDFAPGAGGEGERTGGRGRSRRGDNVAANLNP